MLVMLLIALPVVAMATASTVYRTNAETGSFSREFGTADLVVSGRDINRPIDSSRETTADVSGEGAPTLPSGTMTADFIQVYSGVTADIDGTLTTARAEITDVDLAVPITADLVVIDRGTAPTSAGEALLSDDVAERFDVDVGDTLRLVKPDLNLSVVGIGRDASSLNSPLILLADFDRSLVRPGWHDLRILIDLPDEFDEAQQARLVDAFQNNDSTAGLDVRSETDIFADGDDEVQRDALAWGWVAGVVAFIAVGIIIAAAFATSARRQLVTIGQLSSNGAPERLVRRTMSLQGMWTGLFGALFGITVAVCGTIAAFQAGLFETLANHDVGSLRIDPLDMVVIAATAVVAASVSALIPARSAARIPVLSALAGRRPVATPPTWMAPTGMALFFGGLFLLAGAAGTRDGGDFAAMLAVIGSLGVLFGMVCASPLIVSAIGRVGSRGGGVFRLASRSLDRARARSAAVLTAIATVGALAVAGATTVGTASNLDADATYTPDLSRVQLSFDNYNTYSEAESTAFESGDGIIDLPPVVPAELPADLRQGVERILPDATWTPITQVVDDPLPYWLEKGEPIGDVDPDVATLGGVTVADDAILDDLDFSEEERRVLDETGALAVTPWIGRTAVINTPSGPVEVDLGPSLELLGFDGRPITGEENRRAEEIYGSNPDLVLGNVFVSPAFVEANDLATGVGRYSIENPVDLTSAQRDALSDLQPQFVGDAFTEESIASGYDSLVASSVDFWYPSVEYPTSETPWTLIQLAVAVASLVLVLLVVAIGLSLAATESRDERDVLHAVGAAPRTLRRVAAAKAWVLTMGAAMVAVPTGYITMFVIARATDATAPFPFALVATMLVVIPLLAAGATFVVSSVAQRFRTLTYSTLTPD